MKGDMYENIYEMIF